MSAAEDAIRDADRQAAQDERDRYRGPVALPWSPEQDAAVARERVAQLAAAEHVCRGSPIQPAAAFGVALAVLAGAVDDLEGRVLRTEDVRRGPAAGVLFERARRHLSDAVHYLSGRHLFVAAGNVAWCAALLDAAEGQAIGGAIATRWDQVRSDLPESIRARMPLRNLGPTS